MIPVFKCFHPIHLQRGNTMATFHEIDATQARQLIAGLYPIILDTRDQAAFDQGHIAGAERLTDPVLRRLLKQREFNRPVLVYCYLGQSSRDMATMLNQFGFVQVYSLAGGYPAWCRLSAPAPQASILSGATRSWLAREGFDSGDINGRIGNQTTPLMLAARLGMTELAAELLDAGADINLINSDGNTALWLACFSGSLATIQLLIDRGADLDNQNDNGATALMYAASAGKTEVVLMLLKAAANTSLKTLDDFTALDLAANRQIMQMLRVG